MQIGVDGRSLLPMRSGIGTYLGEILQHLPANEAVDRFHLFSHGAVDLPPHPWVETHIHQARWGLAWYLFQSHSLVNPLGLDLFWGVQSLLPLGLKQQLPSVITVHDCVHRMGTSYAPSALYNHLHRLLLPVSLRRARKILTISQYVAGEIHQYYQVPFSRIEVTPLGVSDVFLRSNMREREIQGVLDKHKIPRPFILAVGNLEPRKNLKTLLQAFALLPSDLHQRYHLVLVGKMGWHPEHLKSGLHSHPLSDRIITTGYVSAEDLPYLYAGAEMLVFPSFYEGFGLPALEAMAAGCPVVASNTSGLGELVGSAGILVDPYGPSDAWRRAIEELARSSGLRNELRTEGFSRAERYKWENCAKSTLDLLTNFSRK